MPAQPQFRMICHCSICQTFNDAEFADVSVYRMKDVNRPAQSVVEFKTFKPPPNVKRGKCVSCGKPVIEVFEAPLFPKLVMVPRAMLGDTVELPAPVGHLFYEGRVNDVDDALPKHTGFLGSQLAFFKHLLFR